MPISYYAPGPDADFLGTYMKAAIAVRQYQDEQKAQAIRWQGVQEYDTLVKSGVPPQEALSRTAPKLFFNDPRALAASTGDIGQGPGRIMTDPTSGRQFIVQPNQKIQAVPQTPTGWTTVMGPNNQIYKIPLTPSETAVAPRVSVPPTPPQVVPLPGAQGSMIVGPTGAGTRIPVDPTEIITVKDKETGVERKLTRAEYALEKVQDEAATLIKQYNAAEAEVKAFNVKPGPDVWNPFGEPYTNKMARIETQLNALGLDTKGNVLPGSKLAQEIGVATPAPAAAAPVIPPTPPPAAMGAVPAPLAPGAPSAPLMPERPNLRYMGYGRRPGAPPPPVTTPLAPNEILMQRGNRRVIFDRNTHQYLRDAP